MSFWTLEMVELASRDDRDSQLVVADWLETGSCRTAAAIFRRREYGPWRLVIAHLAISVPKWTPTDEQLVQIRKHVDAQAELANANTPFGPFGTSLRVWTLPPLPVDEIAEPYKPLMDLVVRASVDFDEAHRRFTMRAADKPSLEWLCRMPGVVDLMAALNEFVVLRTVAPEPTSVIYEPSLDDVIGKLDSEMRDRFPGTSYEFRIRRTYT